MMDAKPKIMIVCDDPAAGNLWAVCLKEAGMESFLIFDPEQVIDGWAKEIPDLVVIDESRGIAAALDIVRALRENGVTPILLITITGNETRILEAYDLGVDECITKPVSPLMFLAKVKSLLRRAWNVPIDELDLVKVGGMALDPKFRQLELPTGERTRLTTLEFRLLFLLMRNSKKAISASDLVEGVWGYSNSGSGVLVKNVIYRLRRKIEPNPNEPIHILTDAGFGYRFEP